MIGLIIFDWDDVFTKGSTEGYYKCYHEAVVGVGVELDPEEEKRRIAAKWGASHEEELGEILKERPELVSRASELYEEHLFGNTFVDCLSVVPGSTELLSRLADTYTIALATGVHPRLLKERVMPKFNVPNVFTQIITAYDLEDPTHAKPHPFIAQKIMKEQGIAAEHAVMVGDAGNDVRMAQAAGIKPIVVLTGHLNREEAEELGVRYIIPDVTHLEEVLSQF
ncbi:MAG TPA: HAD family phosphatase [Candidatus Limnocylindrales bacterium]|nr:HAD family phosphatase [Candidatus Limnocylindrales bacterium]